MIEQLQSTSPKVLGFKMSGKLHDEDYKTFVPMIDDAVAKQGKIRLLAQFVAESGRIVPRRLTGVCTPHQRRLSLAIKQARNIALLPFAGRAA